ncbi:hypothetical protein EZV62_017211 [Acer yangbiense]|uniref:Uncharacterized protein n=1 Tax=Acer yangbiense TaxID=1000413 RepID=A0A5C7HGJ7_9ROSI|nr:hypothetical protein EZV62_017211 [Acer yangbiense]
MQKPRSIHFKEGDTTNHPNYKELKISNCSVDEFWHHVKGNCSFEYLEFDSCLFPLSECFPLPTTLKKLKITNCVDAEHVFSVLMGPNQSIESLEIHSCSSFGSMPTGGIPATLRQLKIVNCRNLKSLSEAFMTKKCCSIFEREHYSKAGTLELRKLEIENCRELEFLPEGLHELRNLDILSIKNCDSIRYFPSGGLPRTCLTSLTISGCHHLKCLPSQLHEVTSLQDLTICRCPYLMDLPEGGPIPFDSCSFDNLLIAIRLIRRMMRSVHMARYQEFVIPYWKYKESIAEPVLAGGKFILRPKMISVVVDSIADCDPYKWPNSKWRCLKVIGNKGDYKEAVSPSDIVCDVSSSIMTRTPSRSLQMQSPAAQQLEQQNQEVQSEQNLLPLWPPLNLVSPFTLFPDDDENLLLKVGPTHEYLEIDSSPLASLLKSKSATAAVNQLKISKLSDLQFLLDLMLPLSHVIPEGEIASLLVDALILDLECNNLQLSQLLFAIIVQ